MVAMFILTLAVLSPLSADLETLELGGHRFHRRLLDNGLRAVAVQDPGDTASVFVVVGAGNRDETAETTGLAHLVEHALFTGTPTLGVDEHERTIKSWGGESNAFTREDYTLYYDHDVPAERLSAVLAMEADRLRNISFTEPAVLHERERLRLEEKHTYQPAHGRNELLEAAVLRVHPYRFGIRDADGHTLAPGLGLETIREFYERHYHPDRTAVVVVGPDRPADMLDRIEEAFGSLPRGARPRNIPVEPPVGEARTERLDSNLARGRTELVWHVPARGDDSRPALEVLASWLDRAELADGTPVDASVGGRVDADLLRVGAGGDGRAAELVRLVESARGEAPVEAELELVRALVADDIDGVPLRARPYFSLAVTFGTFEVFGEAELLVNRASDVRSVTPEQVLAAARTYLAPERCVTVVFEGTGAEQEPLPEDPSALAAAAADAADAGDHERAVLAYTKLLAMKPSRMNQVIYLATRGQLHLSVRDYDAAIGDFESALEVVDYPAVRDLLEEAHARKAAARRGQFQDDEEDGQGESGESGESGAEHDADHDPGHGSDPAHDREHEPRESTVSVEERLLTEVDAACRELESWRGLRFQEPVRPEFVDAGEGPEGKTAGWYESTTGRLVVVRGKSEAFSRGVQLHELFHALQDQAWDLSELHSGTRTTDQEHALRGLIEGEAMLAVSELLDYDFAAHAVIPATGPVDRGRFEKIFHYGTGLRYVAALRDAGGWAAVNRKWGNPPLATSEIFHPGERDDPSPDVAQLIQQDRDQLLDELGLGAADRTDTLGELELRWLVTEEESTRHLAERLGKGFLADSWLLARDGDEIREVWLIRFRDANSARLFMGQGGAAWRSAGWSGLLREPGDTLVRLTR